MKIYTTIILHFDFIFWICITSIIWSMMIQNTLSFYIAIAILKSNQFTMLLIYQLNIIRIEYTFYCFIFLIIPSNGLWWLPHRSIGFNHFFTNKLWLVKGFVSEVLNRDTYFFFSKIKILPYMFNNGVSYVHEFMILLLKHKLTETVISSPFLTVYILITMANVIRQQKYNNSTSIQPDLWLATWSKISIKNKKKHK